MNLKRKRGYLSSISKGNEIKAIAENEKNDACIYYIILLKRKEKKRDT